MEVLKRALTQYGIKEIPGADDNPEIMKYFEAINKTWVVHDETAWCSAGMNWACKEEDKPYSGELYAVSWLDVGAPVEIEDAQTGDIVIYWRGRFNGEKIGSSNIQKGHVGLIINETESHFNTYGGNQKNSWCILPYPKKRVLGVRRV